MKSSSVLKRHWRTLIGLSCLSMCHLAKADYVDCNGSGTVRIWLGTAAEAVANQNQNNLPGRVSDILTAQRKRDGGKEVERLADLYNCTAVVSDPTPSDPNGIYVWLFSEKKGGGTIKQRLAAEKNSFQLWAVGGTKAATAGGPICYDVKYTNDRGAVLESGYLRVDNPKVPFPKAVNKC